MSARDLETRDRVLQAAARLFADRGFKRVTVRDISRSARANVAAVNYHFGNKHELYREVMQLAIDVIKGTNDLAMKEGKGCPPDEKLRRFVQVYVRKVLVITPDNWIFRLINREMADPTSVADLLVDKAIRPRMDYLSEVVGELMKCSPTDPRVLRSVASLHAQLVMYLPNPLAERIGFKRRHSSDDIERVAQHIADFSLAGIRAVKNHSA